MVGVVAGVGLGLERSSANLLGANGLLGAPGFGEGPDDVYVNAVNGNLVILRTDQVLAGIGTNDVVSEAYNSQGTYTAALGASGGSWMGDYQRGVSGLTGTVNTAGSTVTRTAADGSQVVYTYQTTGQYAGMYIGYENSGATDTLTYSAGTNRWTWTDGDTQATETYDWANGGRIMFATDLDGNKLTYNYTGSQLTSIATTDSGGHQDTTSFNYTGSQLTSVSTSYWDIPSGTQKSLTQEYYSYDAQGRLSTVTIDLSPADGSIADGNKFTTTYGYQSTSSNLITSITGSDGSSLTIGYFTGTNKVQTVTQTAATGVTRTTTFSGIYGSGSELVTDPLGVTTSLGYTTGVTNVGLLTRISADVADLSTDDFNQVTQFGGWTNLNVGTITDPDNTVVTYGYNASGDRTSQTDAAGDVTTWTYGSLNQLLATTLTPATGVTDTSYDIYDASNNLRFTVTQQGVVTQYLYGASPGEATSVINYTNDTFSTAGYSASSPPSLATMTSWAAGLADLQNTQRADTTYDIRGDIASVTSYGADTTTGAGATSTTENSVTNYVYNTAGELLTDTPQAATSAYSYGGLQRLPTNAAGATTQYDGFGRITSATNLDGATTRYAYSLTSSSSYAINAMGTVTLTTRDLAGEVTSTTVYAHQLTTAQLTALGAAPTFTAVAADVTVTAGSDETTSYKYDADGRLMMMTDPKGNNSYFLYDTLGRKTADIDALGDVTEYRYNADNHVAETIQYATPLTSTQLTTLAGASAANPVPVSEIRPQTSTADRYTWSIYDAAHRLVETIDGLGAATVYAYDKASNLISTTQYANLLTAAQLAQLEQNPPGFSAQDLSIGGSGWTVEETGDFLGDGQTDLLLENASGTVDVAERSASGSWTYTTVSGLGSEWKFVGAGNFLKDGRTDFLIENTSGTVDVGEISNGSAAYTAVSGLGSEWKFVGSGDYLGHGDTQLLIENTSGAVAVGEVVNGTATYTQVATLGAEWSFYGSGDFLGDGKTGFLIENTSGVVDVGEVVSGTANFTQVATVASGWSIVDAADYRSDGKTGFLIENSSGTVDLDEVTGGTASSVQISGLGSGWTAVNTLASGSDGNGQIVGQSSTKDVEVWTPTASALILPTASPGNDRTTRSFYDGDQRLIGTLDPDGYVTEIFYDSAGQKTQEIAFATAASSSLWASGTFAQLLASVGTSASDDHTWYVYDARGDLRGKVDGDGDVTQYHYDPLGDVDETIAGQTLSVATLLTTPPTMATLSGLSTTGAAVTDLTFNFKGQALTSRNNVVTTPVTNTYDALGNLIETVDANGDKTFSYYDSFNRKIAEVSAVGTLTTWTYDQDNNVSSETTYGDAVTLPGSPGGTPPSPTVANDYRRTSYTYDADGRVTLTSVSAGGGAFAYGNDTIEIGSWNGSSYAVSTPSSLTSQTSYDAFGNVWKSVDANGAATYAFYNAVGQKIAAVDGDGYLTGYNLNTFWDVATQTQYATALSAGTISAFTAATDNVSPTPTTNANDRITSFTYDGDGNVLTQSRANVAYATISANSVSTSSATSTVTYTYNFLGEQLTEHQATGDTTTNVYTAAGRLSKVTNPSYTDAGGGTDTPQSVYSYNGLGLVTSIASGQSGSPSRTTSYTYDAIGRKTSLSDASSFVQYYAYDNDGNLTSVDYLRASSTSTTGAHQTTVNGHSVNEQIVYTYDAANEQLTQATSDWNGSAWVSGDPTSTTYDTANLQYDAYGEVVGKGINGLYQITQTYDGVGRLISSNANGGSTSFFDYDGDGHLTLQIASAGTNLTGDTLSAALTAAGPTIGVSYVPGLNLTISKYDAKGQATAVIQPNQQLNASTHTTFTSSVAYDAFGDAVTSTNALGAATNSFYNTLGQLIETQAPQITVDTVGSGNVVTQNVNLQPTTYDYYDLSGRLVATKDANGNLTTQSLLAGSGYGGSQALIVEQWQPDNGQMIYGYDVFGDQTKVTDQLGRVTTKTFDGMGRLLTQTLPTDSPNAALTDFYAYDGLGQRVAQTNSLLNALSLSGYNSGTLIASAGAKQTSDYDSQGRLVSTEDYLRTYQTTYDYAWSGSAPTTGLGTFGGWTKTDTETQLVQTTNQLGQATAAGTMRTETTTSDFFGHTLSVTPFTGCLYTYNYNAAAEVAGVGSNFAYTYYNSGQVATIAEGPSGSQMVTTYGYDGLAEKVSETQVLGSTSYENETAAYDAMGWVTSIHDTGNAAAEPITMTYAYDANGNVVNAHTVYETLGGNGTGSATQATVDDWFTYDTMNREVTSQGQLSGSTIMRLEQGTDTVYDAAGERVSASSTSQVYNGQTCTYNYDVHTEWYAYTPDGYLKTVTANDTTYTSEPGDVIASSTGAYTAASNSYDAMGRLTQQVEYNAGGSTVAYSRTNIVYNADSLVLSDTTQRDNNGTYANNNELYFYNAATGSGPYGVYEDGQLTNLGIYDTSGLYGSGNTKFTYVYTYSWTTEALQTQIAYTIWGSNGSTAYTNLTYGANNELTSAAVGGVGTISYVNNAEGEIVDRSSSAGPASEYYYLSGHQVGSVSNAGADQFNYASSISNQVGNVTPTGASADFDGTQTVLGSNSPAPTAGSYTIQAGDTLQSIAQNVYGDANLWYLLADTNGLSAGAALAPGQSISLPNQVVNIGNTSQTFKPYDSNQATGQIQPRPMPHNNHGGCGGIGAILAAVVAVVVTLATAGALAGITIPAVLNGGLLALPGGLAEGIAIGAASAAVGDVASQAVELATGAESSFNWAGVALSAIGGAVSVGLAAPLKGLDADLGGVGSIGANVANGAIDGIVTQGIGVATGLQKSFDWTSVATAGVEAGVGGAIGAATNNPYLGSVGALLAGATTRTLLTGENFGQSLVDEAPNTAAVAIGDALGSTIDAALNQGAGSDTERRYGAGAYQVADVSTDTAVTTVPEIVVVADRHDLLGDVLSGNWGWLGSDISHGRLLPKISHFDYSHSGFGYIDPAWQSPAALHQTQVEREQAAVRIQASENTLSGRIYSGMVLTTVALPFVAAGPALATLLRGGAGELGLGEGGVDSVTTLTGKAPGVVLRAPGAAGSPGAIWSGAGAQSAAEQWAVVEGGQVVSMTAEGQAAEAATMGMDSSAAHAIWNGVSANWVASLEGPVTAFIGPGGGASTSTLMEAEIPEVVASQRITGLTIQTVDSSGAYAP